ncbi:metal-sensing transcriptional repressor [Treponema parvum]|nr:metal-sensing transcriptional repressor [Treponema parvum]
MNDKMNCCTESQRTVTEASGKKKTIRSEKTKKLLVSRLNRIAGQISGISRMIEKDSYCVDILIQTSAVQSALKSFSHEIIDRHVRSCVAESVRSGDDSAVDELINTMYKFIK